MNLAGNQLGNIQALTDPQRDQINNFIIQGNEPFANIAAMHDAALEKIEQKEGLATRQAIAGFQDTNGVVAQQQTLVFNNDQHTIGRKKALMGYIQFLLRHCLAENAYNIIKQQQAEARYVKMTEALIDMGPGVLPFHQLFKSKKGFYFYRPQLRHIYILIGEKKVKEAAAANVIQYNSAIYTKLMAMAISNKKLLNEKRAKVTEQQKYSKKMKKTAKRTLAPLATQMKYFRKNKLRSFPLIAENAVTAADISQARTVVADGLLAKVPNTVTRINTKLEQKRRQKERILLASAAQGANPVVQGQIQQADPELLEQIINQ